MGYKSNRRGVQAYRIAQDLVLGGLSQSYMDKVIGYNPIVYFPMNEAALPTAVNRGTLGTAANGTYTGVTLGQTGIGDRETCPYFDGAADYLNGSSAAFIAAFNGNEGAIQSWFRVLNAGAWIDAASRYIFRFETATGDRVYLRKTAVNNQLEVSTREGGVDRTGTTLTLGGSTTWHVAHVLWSKTGGYFRLHLDGAAVPVVNTVFANGIGGVISATKVNFGAVSILPAQVWNGWLAHVSIWTRPLTTAEMADLATV